MAAFVRRLWLITTVLGVALVLAPCAGRVGPQRHAGAEVILP